MNPSGYQSLNKDYGSLIQQTGAAMLPATSESGPKYEFRLFVPPGTFQVSLMIYTYADPITIVRHGKPPGYPPAPGTIESTPKTLIEYAQADQFVRANKEGKLTILNQGRVIAPEEAGWLYARITSTSSSSVNNQKATIWVHADVYNAWRKSVNWDKDVEGVTIYKFGPLVPPVVPPPLSDPDPTPDPEGPEVVTITIDKNKLYRFV